MLGNKRKELENEIVQLEATILAMNKHVNDWENKHKELYREYLNQKNEIDRLIKENNTLLDKQTIINLIVYSLIKKNFGLTDQIPPEVDNMINWFFGVGQ